MRAFIAVELSDEARKKLVEFQSSLPTNGVKSVETENLHLTLFFFGEINDERASAAIKALDSISAKPFTMRVAGAGVFPNPNFIRVAWAGVESQGLKLLYDELEAKLRQGGLKFDSRFSPHVTVARVNSPEAKQKVAEAVEKFKEKEFGEFQVQEVILFKSTLTPSGPIYERVHMKKLR